MEITVSYLKFQIESLAAVAVACSRNVLLCELSKENEVMSMAPGCEAIKSRNSIILLILNINPLDESCSRDLLWHERFVKPILYQFYKSTNLKIHDKSQAILIQKLLRLIDSKFGKILQKHINPLEIILWTDLYLILMENSLYKIEVPDTLKQWFSSINQLDALKKATGLVLGNIQNHLNDIVKNIPVIPVDNSEFNKFEEVSKIQDLTSEFTKIKTSDTMKHFLFGSQNISLPNQFSSPKLPVKGTRNILITSALPYVNNVPHLGNLIGSTLSADIFSRYCRVRGWNSIYVCGTDEYGTTTEVKASQENTTPRLICDHYHKIHAEVYSWFNIDFDIFGRTSSEQHTKIVTEVFNDIYNGGFIIEDSIVQLYCELCEKFLADRLVEGVCPYCSFEDARGDQCDSCGKLINAADLKQPRCKLCNASPVLRSSNHLFLDLTKIQGELDEYLKSVMGSKDCVWSHNAKSITNSWLKEGLKPRCITRDLKWGVPVPLKNFEQKVFYVWFDAVLGYISITSSYTVNWRQWWIKGDCPVELYQFMAKDNVPFHSVIFPANLLASGKNWNMLKQLASTEYLNYENSKFSKSRNLGVFGNNAKDSGIDADVWRFYLASCRPESQDSSFMWEEFATRNNSELLANVGNFINRALSFVAKFYNGLVPDFQQGSSHDDEEFVVDINKHIRSYIDFMDQLKFRDSLATILKISGLGNGYIQRRKPWVNVKLAEMKEQADAAIGIAANLAVLIAVLLGPFMPKISLSILDQCNAPKNANQILEDCRFVAFLQPNHQIGKVSPLFQKMEPEFVAEMKKKYSS